MRTKTINSRKTRALLAVAGAAALVGAGSAAYAAPPWTVTAGSATSGNISYSAATIGTSPQIHFNVPALGMTCTDGTAAGDSSIAGHGIQLGSTSGHVGTIDSTQFNGCLGPLNLPMTVTQHGTWDINATGNTSGSVTPAEIANVSATVANPSCTFDVAGTVAGNFDNSNQHLAITGPSTLQVVGTVSGCFGLIHTGDPATFTATYNVSNATGPISIIG